VEGSRNGKAPGEAQQAARCTGSNVTVTSRNGGEKGGGGCGRGLLAKNTQAEIEIGGASASARDCKNGAADSETKSKRKTFKRSAGGMEPKRGVVKRHLSPRNPTDRKNEPRNRFAHPAVTEGRPDHSPGGTALLEPN